MLQEVRAGSLEKLTLPGKSTEPEVFILISLVCFKNTINTPGNFKAYVMFKNIIYVLRTRHTCVQNQATPPPNA